MKSCALLAASIVLLVLIFVMYESIPALRNLGIARFFTDASWNPLSGQYNLLPMMVGSVLVTGGAILIAAPTGIATALFIEFHAPAPVAWVFRRMIELLAGIPSVVYGFWGLVVLVPLVNHSVLAGILILAIMILPTVTLVAGVSMANVPSGTMQGAAALGLSRWAQIWQVVLPSTRRGITTAIILAFARAIGETMAVLMVCGNVAKLPRGLFDPVRTLTANIALEMSYATASHRSLLFVSGLLLMGLVGLLFASTEWIGTIRKASR